MILGAVAKLCRGTPAMFSSFMLFGNSGSVSPHVRVVGYGEIGAKGVLKPPGNNFQNCD
jgi:hypothetical protein